MKSTATLAGILVMMAMRAFAGNLAEAPEAGSYMANVYVQETTGTCHDKRGDQYAGEMSFSGLGGTTNYIRVPSVGNDDASVFIQTFEITAGKGTLKPSGNMTWYSDGTRQWSYRGTFSATIIEIGTHAFTMSLSLSYAGCTEDWNISMARVSADQ